ncbi:DUF4976 domain-containing protein [Flavivirga rizhaonensis]|uniref:DUF4976 domain-containing protein n=2 Tax=Flavivirga rizhaonensis TaxID=2559571 RepID=A0A4S1DUV4_9FLAO|nr:DUF4976 domain-containing protein [Flavivirga rizhaonensis]
MDALTKEGTVFTNAHTNAPICAPSRASFLIGILKNDNGKPLSGHNLKPFLENPDNPKSKESDVALTVVRGNFKSNEVMEQSYSVRSETYRYIRYVNGKEELYDNEKDPYEWDNLASDKKHSKIKKNLQQQMNQSLNI